MYKIARLFADFEDLIINKNVPNVHLLWDHCVQSVAMLDMRKR